MLWTAGPCSGVPFEIRNFLVRLKLSREVLGGDAYQQTGNQGDGVGEKGLKTEVGGVEG